MDRLSLILSLPVGAVLTGGFAITLFNFDLYAWGPIAGAAIAGFALAWPASYLISRRIKRNDPRWNHRKIEDVDSYVPDPKAQEV
jgi:hypothetical protein